MNDIDLIAVPTLLGGLVFSERNEPNIVRVSIYAFCILYFLIAQIIDLSRAQRIFFAGILTLLVFLFKLTLYILNYLINNSFEISSSSEEIEEIPANIPPDLWARRNEFRGERQINDENVIQFIQMGHDPDKVFAFYNYLHTQQSLSSRNSSRNPPTIHKNSQKDVFIRCFGTIIPMSLNRVVINSYFPSSFPFVYVIFCSILTFTCSLSMTYVYDLFPPSSSFVLCFIYGPSIYSMLHPPDSEPYSTTKGDIQTGLTRSFFLTVIGTLWYIVDYYARNVGIMDFSWIEITIDWEFLDNHLKGLFAYSIILMVVWLHFCITLPTTTIIWILESFSRYFFGVGGSTSFIHSTLQIIRSFVALFVCYVMMKLPLFNNQTALMICIVSLIIQIPLHFSYQLKSIWIQYIINSLIISIITYISSKYLIPYIYPNSHLFLQIACLYVVVFDLLWPYLASNSQYFVFHFRLFGGTSRIINLIRALTPSVIAPIVVLISYKESSSSLALFSIVLVSTITRSFCEPHIFAYGLILHTFTFNDEYLIQDKMLSLYLSAIIARKIVSLYNLCGFYYTARPTERYYDITVEEILFTFFLTRFTYRIDLPDRQIAMPSLIWSMITGAPMNQPFLSGILFYPSAPKPNYFWETSSQSIDIGTTFETKLTEHPVETPVYVSASRALSFAFSSLVKSGRIGVVDSDDIYLFFNDVMTAFVHVIGSDAHCHYFQLRGLEYNNVTSCHRGEINTLRNTISEYEISGNTIISMLFDISVFEIKAINVPLYMYAVSSFSPSTIFIGVDQSNTIQWCIHCYAYMIKKCRLFSVSTGENISTPVNDVLKSMGFIVSDQDSSRVNMIWELICRCLFTNERIDTLHLIQLFNGNYEFGVDERWIVNEIILLDKIVYPTIRCITIILSLVSMNLAPGIDEAAAFIEETEQDYLCTPISNPEFEIAFKSERKTLVTLSTSSETSELLFFRMTENKWNIMKIKREAVKSAWQSESFAQMYLNESSSERASIQMDSLHLHNLLVQSCNHPIGYPALVSPIMVSFAPPSVESNF